LSESSKAGSSYGDAVAFLVAHCGQQMSVDAAGPAFERPRGEGVLDLVESDETRTLISWHDAEAHPAGQIKFDPGTFRKAYGLSGDADGLCVVLSGDPDPFAFPGPSGDWLLTFRFGAREGDAEPRRAESTD
jgi:hypothetical protein